MRPPRYVLYFKPPYWTQPKGIYIRRTSNGYYQAADEGNASKFTASRLLKEITMMPPQSRIRKYMVIIKWTPPSRMPLGQKSKSND